MPRVSSDHEIVRLGYPSLNSVGLVSICWLIFFGLLVFYGVQTPYQVRVAKALAVQEAGLESEDTDLAANEEGINTGSIFGVSIRLISSDCVGLSRKHLQRYMAYRRRSEKDPGCLHPGVPK